MDAATLLRPTRRTTRALAALIVVALVGWLGVVAGHVHVPPAHSAHVAHDPPPSDGDPSHPAGERVHACALCLSLDRSGTPSAPPAIVLALAPHAYELVAPEPPVVDLAPPSLHRNRGPPHA
jgi:hypothetical protein